MNRANERIRKNEILSKMIDEFEANKASGKKYNEFTTEGITDDIMKEFIMIMHGPIENIRSIVRDEPRVAEPL